MPIALLLVPVVSTILGGLFAVRCRRWIHVLLAVGAGLLLGAAFLDLLPEAISIGISAGASARSVLGLTLVSFLVFFIVENILDSISAGANATVPRRAMGRVAGGVLIFHSFRDGMAIGAAFAASHAAGYSVAVGIAAHDLGDGLNTVILTTGGEKPKLLDYLFLLADALAPLAGGLVAIWWFTSARNSMALLAIAAGFFTQMAGSDFLPEVRKANAPRMYAVPCVLSGVGLIYFANLLLGGLR